MTNADGSWKVVEESDFATDAAMHCVRSADDFMVTGTIEEGFFMWHESATTTTVLKLDKPICVIRSGTDFWGEYSDNRMDGVDAFTLNDEKPKLPVGTKVRVKGNHAQPHSGSGHYTTSLLLFAESVTPI